MSRTSHHREQKRQHLGEEFWSRRAGMGNYCYSTYGKRLTIRKERMEAKELIAAGCKEAPFYTEEILCSTT